MAPLILDELAQRISQQEAQLQALRRELETRQQQLADLAQRKETLQRQLREIDAESAAITAGNKPSQGRQSQATQAKPEPATVVGTQTRKGAPATGKRQAAPVKVVGAKTKPGAPGDQPKLPHLLVTILREVGRPLTPRQLAEEAKRRGFQSSSGNFRRLVETRAYDLVRKGVMKRASGQPGFVLAQLQNGKVKKVAAGAGKPAPKAKSGKQVPLRVLLEQILKKSTRPLTGAEVAVLAEEAGYQSSSKSFVDVIWATLSAMKNVVHVPNQGYRLKRSKG
jgi:uncharacterized protein YhaN